jgi:hypothetical protein
MTRNDAGAFAAELAALGEVFGEAISQMRAQLYFDALSVFTLEEIRGAVRAAIQGCRFFPKPAELIELLQGSPEDQAEVAWSRFLYALTHHGTYASIDFGDPTLHAVIETQFGGWHVAWKLESDATRFAHAEFLKLYRAFRKTGQGRTGHCPGTVELDNRERGYLYAIPTPVRLGPGSTPRRALTASTPVELPPALK